MAFGFVKKTWKDRISEYPTRRTLTKEDGSTELVTVSRSEGTVSQEGDAFSADNMNDLEKRVDDALNEANSNFGNVVDTGWLSVTFNDEHQKNVGSLHSLTNGKISNYKQVTAIDLITTSHIGVNLATNNNVYLHPSNSGAFTGTFEYRLRIHY